MLIFFFFNKNVLEAIAVGMNSSILGNFLSIGIPSWKAEEQTNPFPETLVTYIDNKINKYTGFTSLYLVGRK